MHTDVYFGEVWSNFLLRTEMERVTFAKFSIAHKLQVVSFLRCYHAYVDIWLPSMDNEHFLKIELSNKEDANAVAVVRDSLLKGQNRSKFKATSWIRDIKKLADCSIEVKIHKKRLFGTVGRWPRPLHRGGRLMEVVSLLIYNKYFRDFDNWPFNRVWPLNGGPLNRGSTVAAFFACV